MEDILFTRQHHLADRAGEHWDYRIVLGDKAYSWATKKPLPELGGKPILLFQQPVHTADYALSERVEIPKGQYGAGVTTLDWAHKGKAEGVGSDEWKVHLNSGKSYLIKKMPGKYGDKAWLFREINMEKKADLRNMSFGHLMHRITQHNTALAHSLQAGQETLAKSLNKHNFKDGLNLADRYRQALHLKMASDQTIATKSLGEEETAVVDYTERLKKAKAPKLRQALSHALGEEKDHAKSFKEALEKMAELADVAKNVVANRARAAELTNKYLNVLGPTLKKIEAIKDPYAKAGVSLGIW